MEIVSQARELELAYSEIGDDRPLTGCSFSRDGSFLATCAWSGITKVWSMPLVSKHASFKGHTERATDVIDLDELIFIQWGCILELQVLIRHGDYGTLILGQNCFSKKVIVEVYMQFVSIPMDLLLLHVALMRLFVCGTFACGKKHSCIEGHVKPRKWREDNACRIWDLRKRKCEYTIPAHSKLISQVKYEPQEGYFLATSSYDTKAMVWSAQDFKPIKTLSGHESKVCGLDVTADGQHIATVAHDRTIKIWSCKSESKQKAMDID
ncbi:hypothetical protein HPP92_009945 [Vanilla planifolia]|uniref:Uncharacterized protein n=1 Tax=Vanilla planifolia TaxID=51239 RepID=A0A835R349_VANPL|nr:hypothetical protein HPP92_009945 [Vanilla planifolia]